LILTLKLVSSVEGLGFDVSKMLEQKNKAVTGLTGGIAGLFKKNKVGATLGITFMCMFFSMGDCFYGHFLLECASGNLLRGLGEDHRRQRGTIKP
jgi:hypothetical protein